MSVSADDVVRRLADWEVEYPVDAMAWTEANPEIASEVIATAMREDIATLSEDDVRERHGEVARIGDAWFGLVMGLGIAARRPGHDALLEALHLDGRLLSRVLRPGLLRELSWVLRLTAEGDATAVFDLVTSHGGELEGHPIVAGTLSPGARGVLSHALAGCVYDDAISADTVRDGLDALLVRVDGLAESKLSLADAMVFSGQIVELLSILPNTDAHLEWLEALLQDTDVVLDDAKRAAELSGLRTRAAEPRSVRKERETTYWDAHRKRVEHAPAGLLLRKRPKWIEPSQPLADHRNNPQGSVRTADVGFRRSQEGRAAVPNDAWMARLLMLAWDRFAWTVRDLDVARQRRLLLASPGALPGFAANRLDGLLQGVKAFWTWLDREYDLPGASANAASTDDPALRLDIEDAFQRAAMHLQPDSRTARRSMSRNRRRRRKKGG